jgi:hypothetical protein
LPATSLRAVGINVRLDGDHVAANVGRIGCRVARQVEVRVIRETDGRGHIGPGFVADRQRAVVVKCVAHGRHERARKTRVAFGRFVRQDERAVGFPRAPERPVKARRAAVQMVRALVAVERVRDAVEREARIGDPVRPASDRPAEVRAARQVFGWRVVAEQYVRNAARAVGRMPRHERGAEVADRDAHAVRVAQREKLHGVAARQVAPALGGDACAGGKVGAPRVG